jgi:hypothetical protein
VPLSGVIAHYTACPGAPKQALDAVTAIVGTTRPIPIFRSDANPDPAKTRTALLYGATDIPVYDCKTNGWTIAPNASHQKPLYGPAGFGNPFNTYSWAGTVLPQIAAALGVTIPSGIDITQLLEQLTPAGAPLAFGADLWRFDGANVPAQAESVDGLGNSLNYGIRTMVADSHHLYVGTANPMNLKTAPGQPAGGWELRMLTPVGKAE